MKILSGISLDDNFLFFSFVSFKDRKLTPHIDSIIELPCSYSNLGEFIKEHIEDIDKEIREKEKRYSFKTDKIYFTLPQGIAQKVIVEDLISLKTRQSKKKITYKDIIFAKKQIEDITLDLQDLCLHHFVLEYDTEGLRSQVPPIGIRARKIKLKSLIIFINNRLFDEFVYLFDNFNHKFSGFVYEPICDFSSIFGREDKDLSLILHLGYNKTTATPFLNANPIFEECFDFGESEIVNAVAQEFLLPKELAHKVIFNYGSFKNIHFSKEISIKDRNNYINISSMSLNSLMKEVMKRKLEKIIFDLKKKLGQDDFMITFIGRLTQIDGFYNFIKDIFPLKLKRPLFNRASLSAFGCVKYGVSRFLEEYPLERNFLRNIFKVYKDYF